MGMENTPARPENYREYRTDDKSTWGPGPWQEEPDKIQWIDPATGLDCLIVRNPMGALCGYVGVLEGHPLHGLDYTIYKDNKIDLSVHGGVTFAGLCQPSPDEDAHICHVPAPGRPDSVWWLGFDCAHSGDLSPEMEAKVRHIWPERPPKPEGYHSYKPVAYVQKQIESLARQLKEAE